MTGAWSLQNCLTRLMSQNYKLIWIQPLVSSTFHIQSPQHNAMSWWASLVRHCRKQSIWSEDCQCKKNSWKTRKKGWWGAKLASNQPWENLFLTFLPRNSSGRGLSALRFDPLFAFWSSTASRALRWWVPADWPACCARLDVFCVWGSKIDESLHDT